MTQANNYDEIFENVLKQKETLLSKLPPMQECLKNYKMAEGIKNLAVLKKLSYKALGDNPVLVAAMCGPSGAGKSAVFNLITNLNVPSGGHVRPTTYASLAALPEKILNQSTSQELSELFKDFNLKKLESTAILRDQLTPDKVLFYAPYAPPADDEQASTCFIDIPDFNTTEQKNWHKAEQIIKRADSLVFVASAEGYKDSKNFDVLKEVLKLCGSFRYLLTKLNAPDMSAKEAALQIREDIINSARADSGFAVKRQDGLTLYELLEASPFFFSEIKLKKEELTLNGIQPLNTNTSFLNLICRQNAKRTILMHQMQSIAEGAEIGKETYEKAEKLNSVLYGRINKIESQIKEAAKQIVGDDWPILEIFRIIGNTLEELPTTAPERAMNWVKVKTGKTLSYGYEWIKTKTSKAQQFVKEKIDRLYNMLASSKTDIKNENVELTRVKEQTARLIDDWRILYNYKLGEETCRNTENDFIERGLPPIDLKWQEYVANELRMQGVNKSWLHWVNCIKKILFAACGSLVAVDMFVDGGFGTLAGITVCSALPSGAVSIMMEILERMHLAGPAKRAKIAWQTQRKEAYYKHIKANLAGPLFLNREFEAKKIVDFEAINECKNAVRELENCCKSLKEEHDSEY